MRVLLSAFSCHPARGSEPGVGWGIVQVVAREHEVWVLTYAANRPGIEEALSGSLDQLVRVVYVGLPRLISRLAGLPIGHHVCYLAWQVSAFRVARRLHRRVRFDLVHHVTYVNSWLPTLMGYLGIPFIWSAGIRERTPWRFLRAMSWRAAVNEAVRNVVTTLLGWATVWFVGRRAAVIITASPPERWPRGVPVVRLPLGGLGADEIEVLAAVPLRGDARPFRVASVGRLLGLKGIGLGMRAFARLRQEIPDAEYWIIGEGPERNYLERLAQRLGCADAVRFLGWVPREELPQYLAEIDVLLHPSLHEQFGYVALEAMAASRPVVCLDVGGPALLAHDNGGVRLPVRDPEQVIADLVAALRQYALAPSTRHTAGMNARACAQREWSWETVGARLLCLYEHVCGRASCR